MSVPGEGLAKGLAVTLKTMTRRSTTQQYPDVEPDLPPRSRGVIALSEQNCTSCMLCARECPDWCIYIDSHKEDVIVPGAARPRQRNVLDRFAIDFSLCMYCGICIEVCPFDALYWTPEFEYSELDLRDLLHEKPRLGEWMQTVPPPPAHDPMGEPAKEETAAAKKAAGPGAATPAKSAGVRRPATSPARPATPAGAQAAEAPPAAAPPQPATPGTTPAAAGPTTPTTAGPTTPTTPTTPAAAGPAAAAAETPVEAAHGTTPAQQPPAAPHASRKPEAPKPEAPEAPDAPEARPERGA